MVRFMCFTWQLFFGQPLFSRLCLIFFIFLNSSIYLFFNLFSFQFFFCFLKRHKLLLPLFGKCNFFIKFKLWILFHLCLLGWGHCVCAWWRFHYNLRCRLHWLFLFLIWKYRFFFREFNFGFLWCWLRHNRNYCMRLFLSLSISCLRIAILKFWKFTILSLGLDEFISNCLRSLCYSWLWFWLFLNDRSFSQNGKIFVYFGC